MIARFALVLVLACHPSEIGPRVRIEPLSFDATQIRIDVFVPSARTRPFSTLVLFHGAGGNGRAMVEAWRELAEREGIVLVAPTLTLSAAEETRLPTLLPALLDRGTRGLAVDPDRTFAFGYSAGGYFAFDAVTVVAPRFAGAAVFASMIQPAYAGIVDHVARKSPVAIYIGDHDQFFSLQQVRGTRDLLQAHGFPVHYVELENADHDYAAAAERINLDAWRYLNAPHRVE